MWLKPYVDISAKLGINANNNFEKEFLKPMKNYAFRKTVLV